MNFFPPFLLSTIPLFGEMPLVDPFAFDGQGIFIVAQVKLTFLLWLTIFYFGQHDI